MGMRKVGRDAISVAGESIGEFDYRIEVVATGGKNSVHVLVRQSPNLVEAVVNGDDNMILIVDGTRVSLNPTNVDLAADWFQFESSGPIPE